LIIQGILQLNLLLNGLEDLNDYLCLLAFMSKYLCPAMTAILEKKRNLEEHHVRNIPAKFAVECFSGIR
jgi:hypothetical protein